MDKNSVTAFGRLDNNRPQHSGMTRQKVQKVLVDLTFPNFGVRPFV